MLYWSYCKFTIPDNDRHESALRNNDSQYWIQIQRICYRSHAHVLCWYGISRRTNFLHSHLMSDPAKIQEENYMIISKAMNAAVAACSVGNKVNDCKMMRLQKCMPKFLSHCGRCATCMKLLLRSSKIKMNHYLSISLLIQSDFRYEFCHFSNSSISAVLLSCFVQQIGIDFDAKALPISSTSKQIIKNGMV